METFNLDRESIATGHNPDNLSDVVVGTESGWRLLAADELNSVPALPKNDETAEEWNGEAWDLLSTLHHNMGTTYRTKRKK